MRVSLFLSHSDSYMSKKRHRFHKNHFDPTEDNSFCTSFFLFSSGFSCSVDLWSALLKEFNETFRNTTIAWSIAYPILVGLWVADMIF